MRGNAACIIELGPKIRLDKSNKPGRIDSIRHVNLENYIMIGISNTFKHVIAIVHNDPAYSPTGTNITFS